MLRRLPVSDGRLLLEVLRQTMAPDGEAAVAISRCHAVDVLGHLLATDVGRCVIVDSAECLQHVVDSLVRCVIHFIWTKRNLIFLSQRLPESVDGGAGRATDGRRDVGPARRPPRRHQDAALHRQTRVHPQSPAKPGVSLAVTIALLPLLTRLYLVLFS